MVVHDRAQRLHADSRHWANFQAPREAAQDISYENMTRHQKAVSDIIEKNDSIQGVMSSVGGSAGNAGRVLIALKPFEERHKKADDIVKELRPKLAQVPGINTFLQVPPSIRIGGMSSKSSYQVTLMSPEQDELYKATLALKAKMDDFKELTDVNTDIQTATPQIDIKVNRAMAAALGITQDQVEQTLASAYGQRQVSTIYAPTNQYKVLIELEPKYQRDPVQLSKLYIRSTSGKMVPLGAIAQLTPGTGPLQINHLGQFPSATISFNLRPGTSIGQAVDHITEVANATVPGTVSVNFQGQAKTFQESFSNLGWLLLLATVIIYVILGMLYESFIHPLTILSGLPAAALGALITLADLPRRLRHLRLPRVDTTDRHRQKERHHDDRLLAGIGTRERAARRGSNLSSMPGALSPDYDDDNGSSHGHASDCLWIWGRSRHKTPARSALLSAD